MDLARLDTRARDSGLVVRVQGEVDASNASAIGDEIVAEAVSCRARLVVDLTDTEYVDSAGIRMLFSLRSRLDLGGHRVCLAVPAQSPTRKVLDLAEVRQVIPLAETVDEAMKLSGGGR